MENKRKNFLIDPKFQFSVMGYAWVAGALTGLLVAVVSFYFLKSFEFKAHELGLPADHIYFSFIEDQISVMMKTFMSLSFFISLLILSYGLIISNRIAGPIYRIRKFIADYDPSQSQKLTIRDKDYFSDLATDINSFIDKTKKSK